MGFQLSKDMDTETYRRLTEQLTKRGPWQQTATGKAFFLADPRPEEVDLEDIAWALARTCRYNGHLKPGMRPYSVAQHETLVSKWMEEDGHPWRLVYAAHHHDSPEGYYGDFVSQVKFCVPAIRDFTKPIDLAVNTALGVPKLTEAEEKLIKNYDLIALATEMRDLLAPHTGKFSWGALPPAREETIFPWSHQSSYEMFLYRHDFIRAQMDG